MRLIALAVAMMMNFNIVAQMSLTLENTTPGTTEYNSHRPKHGSVIFDDNNNLIRDTDKTKWDSLINVLYNKDIYYQSTCYDRCSRNGNIAYKKGDTLFVFTAHNKTSKAITTPQNGIVVAEAVHRNEFGITKGTFWSEQGNKLAYYEMDESMVSEYPIVDITQRIAKVRPLRYPMAGETSHEVKVKIYDTQKETTTTINTEMTGDSYFTNIAWRPDGKSICMAEINRAQNEMHFNIYNAETGNLTATVFTEKDSNWIEPCKPAIFIDNDNFVWLSDRDGYTHIYLYNINTKKHRQLTFGNWCVSDIYGYCPSTKSVYFQSNERGFLYKDIYRVTLKGKKTCLTNDNIGVHTATFAPDRSSFVDYLSSVDIATKTTWRNNKGEVIEELNETVNPYKGYKLPSFELKQLKTADNKHDLYGLMIKPSDFDSLKKYPVMVYVYGGPHSQLVNGSWLYGTSPWMMYMAEQGYIIWIMDNRGTELRGRAFEKIIHRKLGENERADQMKGIELLKTLPYIDTSRIGIHGWSYGGFMTLTLMCEEPETFKAGVAGGPVTDWSLYEVMYGERYMDTPQENKEGYKNTSILNKIDKIKGKTLIIHGDIDPVVVWQHSLQLLKKSVETNTMIDYAVYPQHEHNVLGKDRVHLIRRIIRYFDDNLK